MAHMILNSGFHVLGLSPSLIDRKFRTAESLCALRRRSSKDKKTECIPMCEGKTRESNVRDEIAGSQFLSGLQQLGGQLLFNSSLRRFMATSTV
jgi:hypothetical protein